MIIFTKDHLKEISDIECGVGDYRCDKLKFMFNYKIDYMIKDLNKIQTIEKRLEDLKNYTNNYKDTLSIINDETKDSKETLNDTTNHFSLENYQLDELNNNKKNIDKQMDLYVSQLKKLFYTISALTFIFYIIKSFNPPK